MGKRLKPSDVLRIARTFGDPWEGTEEKKSILPSMPKLSEVADKIKSLGK